MLSHIVVFWTNPAVPDAEARLLEGARRLLPGIPGVLSFHAGRMVPSDRPVVDCTYQVALNLVFADKAAEQAYQAHPDHQAFVEQVFRPCCTRVAVYDFAD